MVNFRRKIPFYKKKVFIWSVLAFLATALGIWLQLVPKNGVNPGDGHSTSSKKSSPGKANIKFPPDFAGVSNKLSHLEALYHHKKDKVDNLIPYPMTRGHLGRISDFIFLDKGKKLLSASKDGSLMLWNISDLDFPRLESTTMFPSPIDRIAISPDERFMAVYAGSLKLFNLKKKCAYTDINKEKMPITAMAFSRKGRYLAFSTLSNKLIVYDLEKIKLNSNGTLISKFDLGDTNVILPESRDSKITALDFSNNRLAAAFEDGTILLYHMDKGFNKIVEIAEHEGRVTSLCFSNDGKHLLSGGEDKYILQFDADGNFVQEFAELATLPLKMTFSPDGHFVFVGSEAGDSIITTGLYQYPEGVLVNEMNEHPDRVSALAATKREGQPLFVTGGCFNKDILFWDGAGNVVGRIDKNGDPVVAVGMTKKKDVVFNLSDQPNMVNHEGEFDFYFNTNFLSLASNFDSLEVTQEIHEINDYSLKLIHNFKPAIDIMHPRQALGIYKKGELVAHILKGDLNGDSFTSYTFVGDRFIVVGGKNGNMEAFNLNGDHLGHLVGHYGDILDLAPSVDGKMLVSASNDRSFCLWDFSLTSPNNKAYKKDITYQFHKKYGFLEEEAKKIDRIVSAYFSKDSDGWKAITNYLVPPEFEKKPMVTVMIQNKDWVAWTAAGYYCSSTREIMDLFGGFYGHSYYKSDVLYDKFFNDFNVRLSIANHSKYLSDIPGTSARARTLSSNSYKAPKVKIISPVDGQENSGDEVEAVIRIRDEGGGIGDIRLFLNGKLIASNGALQLTRNKTSGNYLRNYKNGITEISEGVLEMKYPVKLIAGANEISCQAYNRKNNVASSMRAVNIVADTMKEPSKLYVLTIGIQYFKDKKINLRYTNRDASTIADLFEDMGSVGYDDIDVTLLLDPSKEKINQTIASLKDRMTLYDTFLFHVSSHGLAKKNTYAFVTADFNGKDDWDVLVTIDELMEFSKNIPALKQVFVLDTCFSGSVSSGYRDVYEKRVSRFSKGSGIHIISASAPRRAALEGYQGHGFFTFFFLDALRGRCDEDSDGKITIVEIIRYTARKLYATTRGYQLPELSWSGRNFSLITYKKESVTFQ